jgi:hypothetical protein
MVPSKTRQSNLVDNNRKVMTMMIRSLCITLGFGLALINSANSQTTQAVYNVKVENVAAGKHVTSETPANPAYRRAAKRLTDGNLETDAYPGAFSLDYTVSLLVNGDKDTAVAATSYDVQTVVISWGKYGRRFPGEKKADGSWVPAAYEADYVNEYSVEYLTRQSEDWILLHKCKGRPTDEVANGVVVKRSPESSTSSEGIVSTTLVDLPLRDVIAFRLKAKGDHWIGVCELEILGSDAGKRMHFQDSQEGLEVDDADRVKQRNLLLGEARAKIQQGLWDLGEKYPQLRIGVNKKTRQQEITKEPQVETGPTHGFAIYLPQHKGKYELAVKLEKEEMYQMMVYIEPDGYECGSGFMLAPLYPNIGLIGQINVWAADKTLDAKLKALVNDSLEPLKKLNDTFEKQEKP